MLSTRHHRVPFAVVLNKVAFNEEIKYALGSYYLKPLSASVTLI